MKKTAVTAIAVLLFSTPASALDNPFLELSKGLDSIRSLKGNLVMEASSGKERRRSAGKLFFLEPERIRLHLIEPEEYELYQDGSFLRIYQPASRIVEVYRKEKLSPDATLLLGRLQKLPWECLRSLKGYSFTEKGKNKAGERVLFGLPFTEGQPKCLVWLPINASFPRRVDFFEPRGERRLNSTTFGDYRKIDKICLPLSVEIREKSLRFALHFSKMSLNLPFSENAVSFKALPGMLIENK